jgi:hypothetical protein
VKKENKRNVEGNKRSVSSHQPKINPRHIDRAQSATFTKQSTLTVESRTLETQVLYNAMLKTSWDFCLRHGIVVVKGMCHPVHPWIPKIMCKFLFHLYFQDPPRTKPVRVLRLAEFRIDSLAHPSNVTLRLGERSHLDSVHKIVVAYPRRIVPRYPHAIRPARTKVTIQPTTKGNKTQEQDVSSINGVANSSNGFAWCMDVPHGPVVLRQGCKRSAAGLESVHSAHDLPHIVVGPLGCWVNGQVFVRSGIVPFCFRHTIVVSLLVRGALLG